MEMAAMAKHEQQKMVSTVANEIENCFAEIESLRDELQEWYDNMPEGPQNGDKGQALQDCIDALEQSSCPDIPVEDDKEAPAWWRAKVEYAPYFSTPKKAMRASRAARCSAQAFIIGVVIEVLTEWVADWDQQGVTEKESEALEEARIMVETLETARDEWEGAEFPGMYG